MERVLIVPWGNPFQWDSITYEYGGCRMKSSSTLPVLINALKPEKILIFTLDTLANIQVRGKPDIEPKDFKRYSEVVEDVQSRIKWFIENELSSDFPDSAEMLKDGRIDIVVAPGVGLFKNINVEGDLLDFYNYALYVLSTKLPSNNLEVYLDLTHGINFMPTLLYRALNNLLGISAFINDCRLVVLNSEPYPQGFQRDEKESIIPITTLHIRTVEDIVLRPKPIYSRVEDNKLSAFISSLANGLPLVFTTFYPELNELKTLIDEELAEFLKNIEVNGIHISRSRGFSNDFKTLTKIYYFIRCLNLSHEMFGGLPKEEVSIDTLECLVELIFKKIRRLEIITKRDVRQIRDTIKKAIKKEGKIRDKLRAGEKLLYLDVYNFAKDRSIPKKDKIDPRDFVAHSGLISDLIYVRLREDDELLSYVDYDKVIELSIKSMWSDWV
ncbi:CRISPR-associated CARF protein Csx1 [Archaeoglobus sp.]